VMEPPVGSCVRARVGGRRSVRLPLRSRRAGCSRGGVCAIGMSVESRSHGLRHAAPRAPHGRAPVRSQPAPYFSALQLGARGLLHTRLDGLHGLMARATLVRMGCGAGSRPVSGGRQGFVLADTQTAPRGGLNALLTLSMSAFSQVQHDWRVVNVATCTSARGPHQRPPPARGSRCVPCWTSQEHLVTAGLLKPDPPHPTTTRPADYPRSSHTHAFGLYH